MIAYTCVYGGRDRYVEPAVSHIGLELFTDCPIPTQRARVRLDGPSWITDPVRRSRCVKILPHLWLPDHDVSLWVDASMTWAGTSPLALADTYLKDADIAVVRHYKWDCLYDEAEECVQLGLDDERLIRDQMSKYEFDGFPRHAGLFYTCIVLRRNTPEIQRFNEAWWAELCRVTRRDQLSLPYVLSRLKIKANVIEGPYDSIGFVQGAHAAPLATTRRQVYTPPVT